MGIHRGGSRTLILACVLMLAAPLAWSADDTSTAGTTVSNNQSFNPPPEFRAMATMSLGNMLSCAITPMVQGAAAFSDGMKAGLKQFSQNACGKEYSIDASQIKCDLYKDESGFFQASKLKETEDQLLASIEAVNCRKGKVEALNNELSCLTKEANLLAQQVGSLQSAYTQNIQRMQQDAAKLTALEEDRKAQLEDVSGKLTGKSAEGSKGLLGVREEMQQAIAAMPGKIQQIKEDQLEVVRLRQSLEEMAQSRTVVLANSCFTRIRPSFKCTPNGKPVNAREYVLCRFKQNRKIGPKGVIQEGEVAEKQAEAKTKELETILDSILDESPTDPAKVKSPEDQQLAANKPIKILTVSDLEARYGAQLAQFNGNGLDIRQFISQTMGSCFGEARKSVKRERTIINSGLSQMAENIRKKERATSVGVNELLNGYAQIHSDAMAALTGQHLPLNVSNCQNAKPEIQLGCLTDVRRNMEGLLSGTTPNSTMDIMIKGQSAATNISFKCQGLNGCITYMQNAQRNLQQEVKKVGQFKKDYILKANQSIDAFTNQMAQTMSGQSQQLNSRIQQLNATLASLGVSPGIKIGQVRGRPLKKGEDGIYEMPENIMDLVGSKMNPPLRDVQGEDFSDALGGISEKVKEFEKKLAELEGAKKLMAGKKAECEKADMIAFNAKLATDMTALDTNECSLDAAFCEDAAAGSALSRLLNGLPGELQLGGTNGSELLNGISIPCMQDTERNTNLLADKQKDLDKKKAAHAAAKAEWEKASTADAPNAAVLKVAMESAEKDVDKLKEEITKLKTAKNKLATCKSISTRVTSQIAGFKASREKNGSSADSALGGGK